MTSSKPPAAPERRGLRIAVVGASGLVGRAVRHELQAARPDWTVVGTAHRRLDDGLAPLDLRDAAAIEAFFATYAPDAVVLAAAERRPDVCEREPAMARALNVDAVRFVAAAAHARRAWVLSISTDYVFDGTQPPYRIGDAPHPLNAYGQSKLDGERALIESTRFGCVLRLPLLYGHIVDWHESAVTSLVPAVIAASKAGAPPAVMDAWATRYPTSTGDVAFVVRQLLERVAAEEAPCGIVQWSGNEPMTKFDIAMRIARQLDVDARLVPQLTPTDTTPRPRDCHLDSSRLETLGIGRRTPFDVALADILATFARRSTH